MSRGKATAGVIALAVLMLSFGAALSIGSSRAASPEIVFSGAGDWGSWGGFDESRRILSETDSAFTFALGDLSYGGMPESQWCDEFHRTTKNLLIIAGNHDIGLPEDVNTSINRFIQYCPFPLTVPLVGVYGKQYYFDYPRDTPLVRFILISPDLKFVVDGGELYDYSAGTERYHWTMNAIDGAREAGIPWVIVGMHKDCIAAGEHGCEIGVDIENLMIDRKVDIIWQAHNHHYERSKQLALGQGCDGIVDHVYNPACVVSSGADGQYTKGMGSVIVITGTGGREQVEFDTTNPFADYIASAGGPSTGLGRGVATFHLRRDRIALETHFNGTYQDAFTVAAPPGRPSFLEALPREVPFVAPAVVAAEVLLLGFLVGRRRRRRSVPSRPAPRPTPRPRQRPPPPARALRPFVIPNGLANGGTVSGSARGRRFVLDESGALRLED